jgi:predicted O-methyltransferase YrrM
MEMMLWNTVLSLFTGLLIWLAKTLWDETQRIQILLNRTREEIARDNVTQAEIDKIVAHIDQRFDKLNDKLDAFVKEQRSALS